MKSKVTISEDSAESDYLSALPSIDELLNSEVGRHIAAEAGSRKAVEIAREACSQLRHEIRSGRFSIEMPSDANRERIFKDLTIERMAELEARHVGGELRPVINATGVLLHTNLGRAPLSRAAASYMSDLSKAYCNLEFDLRSGKRGLRGESAESAICELTGAEASIIVNNCAAAAILVLTALAAGREVVISRGELVEIGGDFRIPDVLAASGANIREVGTTNRTKLTDYERAIGQDTALILRVHPSNYRMIGFTEVPKLRELAEAAHRNGLVLMEDAGSGMLTDLSEYGLDSEPLIGRSLEEGADIVIFSGDKLLGGPQAGIIAGRSHLIDTVRKHPLYRAVRASKLIYGALEATLRSYRLGTQLEDIPVLRMLAEERASVALRSGEFVDELRRRTTLEVVLLDGDSVVGGGCAPELRLPTSLIAISSKRGSAEEIDFRLRQFDPPVVARIQDDKVILDLRTVEECDQALLMDILANLEP